MAAMGITKSTLRQEMMALETQSRPELLGLAGVRAPGELRPLKPTLFAGLSFQWDLPWNMATSERKALLAVRISELEWNQLRYVESREVETGLSLPPWNSIQKEWESLLKQEELLEKIYEASRGRYASGRGTSLDLASAQDALNALQLEKQNFLLDLSDSLFQAFLLQKDWNTLRHWLGG
jgi:hypothetical protein